MVKCLKMVTKMYFAHAPPLQIFVKSKPYFFYVFHACAIEIKPFLYNLNKLISSLNLARTM